MNYRYLVAVALFFGAWTIQSLSLDTSSKALVSMPSNGVDATRIQKGDGKLWTLTFGEKYFNPSWLKNAFSVRTNEKVKDEKPNYDRLKTKLSNLHTTDGGLNDLGSMLKSPRIFHRYQIDSKPKIEHKIIVDDAKNDSIDESKINESNIFYDAHNDVYEDDDKDVFYDASSYDPFEKKDALPIIKQKIDEQRNQEMPTNSYIKDRIELEDRLNSARNPEVIKKAVDVLHALIVKNPNRTKVY